MKLTVSEENQILKRTLRELLDNLAADPTMKREMRWGENRIFQRDHDTPALILAAARRVNEYLHANREDLGQRSARAGAIREVDQRIFIPAWNGQSAQEQPTRARDTEDPRPLSERVIFIPNRD